MSEKKEYIAVPTDEETAGLPAYTKEKEPNVTVITSAPRRRTSKITVLIGSAIALLGLTHLAYSPIKSYVADQQLGFQQENAPEPCFLKKYEQFHELQHHMDLLADRFRDSKNSWHDIEDNNNNFKPFPHADNFHGGQDGPHGGHGFPDDKEHSEKHPGQQGDKDHSKKLPHEDQNEKENSGHQGGKDHPTEHSFHDHKVRKPFCRSQVLEATSTILKFSPEEFQSAGIFAKSFFSRGSHIRLSKSNDESVQDVVLNVTIFTGKKELQDEVKFSTFEHEGQYTFQLERELGQLPPPPKDGQPPHHPPPHPPKDGEPPRPPKDGEPPRPPKDGEPPHPPKDGEPPRPPKDGEPPRPPKDGEPPHPPKDGEPPHPPKDGEPPRPPKDGEPPHPPKDGEPPRPPKDGEPPHPPKDGEPPHPPKDGEPPHPPKDGEHPHPPKDGNPPHHLPPHPPKDEEPPKDGQPPHHPPHELFEEIKEDCLYYEIDVIFPSNTDYYDGLVLETQEALVKGGQGLDSIEFGLIKASLDHGVILFDNLRAKKMLFGVMGGAIKGKYQPSESFLGGVYHGPVDVQVEPSSSNLNITATSVFGPVNVRVPKTYTGGFTLYNHDGSPAAIQAVNPNNIHVTQLMHDLKNGYHRQGNDESHIILEAKFHGGERLEFY